MTDVGGVPVVHTGGWDNGGGGWIGMLLVLALLGGGRGFGHGFGGFGGGCGGFGGFPESRIENRVDFDFLRQGQFGIQKEICQVDRDVLLSGRDIIHNMDKCCCETNRNIDSVKLEACKNTDRIVENATHNTQRILDKMCADELRIAYAKIAEQGQSLSEARIIAAMKPVQPVPAYLQPNPFAQFGPREGCCPV